MFGPTPVGDCSMAGAGHRAEVAEPALSGRSAVVHGHIAFGVVQIHVLAEAGAEGEDIGDLFGSDRGPETCRYFIAVDWGYFGGIQHRLDAELTPATAQELQQLIEGDRVAVFGPHYRVTGTQGGFGKVEVQDHPRPRR